MFQWSVTSFIAGTIFWPWPNNYEHQLFDWLSFWLLFSIQWYLPLSFCFVSKWCCHWKRTIFMFTNSFVSTVMIWVWKKKKKCLNKVLVWTLGHRSSCLSHSNGSFTISYVIRNEYHVSITTWYSLQDGLGCPRVMLTPKKLVHNI